MRIPFPERISLLYSILFATLLAGVQLLEGTNQYFSLCSFLFIIIANHRFQSCGRPLPVPPGAYVFFFSLLGVIIGLTWKAILGQPADTFLTTPLLTMQVYLGCITSMLVAVYVSTKLTRKTPILGNMVNDVNMQNATTGCMVTGVIVTAAISFVPYSSGSVLSALNQINRFLPMAIILGVIHRVRMTGGKSSTSIPVVVAGAFMFSIGLIGFSKEGMMLPFVCWVAAAGSQRFKLSMFQLGGILLWVIFMFQYLVPYSQYGRVFKTFTPGEDVFTAISLLSDLQNVREQNDLMEAAAFEEHIRGYYNTEQGFFDRLEMISPDDGLISTTEDKGPYGFEPIFLDFVALIPHVFWPGKPTLFYGNLYAHRGWRYRRRRRRNHRHLLFLQLAEAYHLGRWTGVFIAAPILWIMLFTLFDSLCGSTHQSPWGLLITATFAHMAPEGMLGGAIYMMGFGTIGIVFAAVCAAYVMPLIGTLFAGPEHTGLRRFGPIGSFVRRHAPNQS